MTPLGCENSTLDVMEGACSVMACCCRGKERFFIHCFQKELETRNAGFCGGRKTGEPGDTPSVQQC